MERVQESPPQRMAILAEVQPGVLLGPGLPPEEQVEGHEVCHARGHAEHHLCGPQCTLWTWRSPEFQILMFCSAKLSSKPNLGLRRPTCWRFSDS